MNEAVTYVLNRLTNTTAWIGVIGLVLLVLHLHLLLVILFILLFFLPEKDFSALFSRWTKSIKDSVEEE